MAARYYYLMSALPALPPLFEPLPMGPRKFVSTARLEAAEAGAVADAVIAELDLWAISSSVPGYRPMSRLAEGLIEQSAVPNWHRYETLLLSLSARLPCSFLQRITLLDRFVRYELMKHRTPRAQIPFYGDEERAPFLEGAARRMASGWAAQSSIYGGYQSLTSDRYHWLMSQWPVDPFSIDEFCAYAKALSLLQRARKESEQRKTRTQ